MRESWRVLKQVGPTRDTTTSWTLHIWSLSICRHVKQTCQNRRMTSDPKHSNFGHIYANLDKIHSCAAQIPQKCIVAAGSTVDKLYKSCDLRPGWNDFVLDIMIILIIIKFTFGPLAKQPAEQKTKGQSYNPKWILDWSYWNKSKTDNSAVFSAGFNLHKCRYGSNTEV